MSIFNEEYFVFILLLFFSFFLIKIITTRPQKTDFVRMAKLHDCLIVPFSAVGIADSVNILLDQNGMIYGVLYVLDVLDIECLFCMYFDTCMASMYHYTDILILNIYYMYIFSILYLIHPYYYTYFTDLYIRYACSIPI